MQPQKQTQVSEREALRQKFIQRTSNPPLTCTEFSDEWREYVQEMRELENALREAGEVF